MGSGVEQPRQVGGVVGEVGVHLHDEAGPAVERDAEAGDVGGAEAFLAGAVEDPDPLMALGEPVGDPARAVR